MRLGYGCGLVMMGMLWGCAMVNKTTPPGAAPLFQADSTDTVVLRNIQREQEARLSSCGQHQSCDQVHFTRGMIGLFQNGKAAAASFEQAIVVAPNGPFADLSARWVRLLRTVHPASADEPNGALLEVMKELVRTWLEQQRMASASATLRSEETDRSPEPAHTLQRRIRDRDKKIAELTDQLSALKQIDLDSKETRNLTLRRTPAK